MITKSEKEVLKPVLGNHYAHKVLSLLNEDGLRNNSGDPYTIDYIRQVFNGNSENLDIEMAIYDLYDLIILKRKKLSSRKKSFSNKEKLKQ